MCRKCLSTYCGSGEGWCARIHIGIGPYVRRAWNVVHRIVEHFRWISRTRGYNWRTTADPEDHENEENPEPCEFWTPNQIETLYSRVNIFQFFEQPLVLATHEFLIPHHLVPRRVKLGVLTSKCLVFRYVRTQQLTQLRWFELGELVQIDRGWCQRDASFTSCKYFFLYLENSLFNSCLLMLFYRTSRISVVFHAYEFGVKKKCAWKLQYRYWKFLCINSLWEFKHIHVRNLKWGYLKINITVAGYKLKFILQYVWWVCQRLVYEVFLANLVNIWPWPPSICLKFFCFCTSSKKDWI